MSAGVLEQLKSEGFASEAAFLSTATALRSYLARTNEVVSLRKALERGAITDEALRQFVALLMRDLRPDERFPHELALSALAVALETRSTGLAEEFLNDLARLRLAEMSICIRVARECVHNRVSLATSKCKVFSVFSDEAEVPLSFANGPSARSAGDVHVTQLQSKYGAA